MGAWRREEKLWFLWNTEHIIWGCSPVGSAWIHIKQLWMLPVYGLFLGPFWFVLLQQRQNTSNIWFKWMPDQAVTQRNAWRISVSLSVLCLKQGFSPNKYLLLKTPFLSPQSWFCNSRNHVVWLILTFTNLPIAAHFSLNHGKIKCLVWNLPSIFVDFFAFLTYLQN
jgi:hypothetical protein